MLKVQINEKGRLIRLLDNKTARAPQKVYIKESDESAFRNLMRIQCVKNYEITQADDEEYLNFIEKEQMIQNTRPELKKKRITGGNGSVNMNLKIGGK